MKTYTAFIKNDKVHSLIDLVLGNILFNITKYYTTKNEFTLEPLAIRDINFLKLTNKK